MPHPAPLLPLLGVFALVLAGVGGLGAAENASRDFSDQARLTAQAKAAGHPPQAAASAASGAPAPRRTLAATRTASSTPLSIGTVTVASPADPSQVPRFAKVELLVPLTTAVAASNFYNPYPASGGITLAATFTGPLGSWTIPGFYDGASWRIRFAPDTVGVWSYVVSAQDASGTASAAPGSFTVVANPSNHGWVRINGGHLAYSADGTPFVGIGHNNGWLDGVEQPAISAMPASGENVLSFWLANPFGSSNRNPIEGSTSAGGSGIGIYNQVSCATIDALFAHAEQCGVLLLPSIWAHDQLWDGQLPPSSPPSSGSWSGNAYSQIIDPATTQPINPIDFFRIVDSSNAATAQWTYQTNFYRYLIARWGYSTSLLGWVGMVEIDQTTAYLTTGGASLGDAWCQSVQGYFALNDPYRGAQQASGAVPVAFSKTDQDRAALAFAPSNPSFPLRIVDSYKSQTDAVGIATTIATETLILSANGATPCFHSEFGAMVTQPDTLEPQHFHNALWAGIAAGAALAPLKYCDGGHWPLITDATLGSAYQAHLLQLATFLRSVPYAGSANVASAQLAVGRLAQNVAGATLAVNAWGQALSDRAFAWLQATSTDQNSHVVSNGTLGSGTLTVSGLSDGSYQASWYDPWGTTLTASSPSTPASSGGTLSIAIPASPSNHADLALTLRRRPSATAQTVTVVAGTSAAITLGGSAGGDALTGATIATLPNAGTLSQTSDGVTPAAAIASAPTPVTALPPVVIYTAGSVPGSDSFTFTVADGALVSDPAAVQIVIAPINRAPTFNGGNAALQINENALTATFPGWATAIANGPGDTSALTGFTVTTDQPTLFTTPPAIDLATGTLTINVKPDVYTSGGQPVHASAVLMDNGSTAGGGANTSAPVPFTITINQIALQPQLPNQALTSFPAYPLNAIIAGSVPDHAPLSYQLDPAHMPLHGSVALSGGAPALATYTAAAGYSGSDSFGVLATDTVGAGANVNSPALTTAATISLTVTANQPPLAYAQALSVPENQALGIVLLGNDPDHQPNPVLAYTIATPPAHGTLSDAPPSLTYTPQTDYVGPDSFTFTTSDGLATSAPAAVSITVMAGGSGSSGSSGGRCGSGNGFAALALLALGLGGGWRWRRARAGR